MYLKVLTSLSFILVYDCHFIFDSQIVGKYSKLKDYLVIFITLLIVMYARAVIFLLSLCKGCYIYI